jgi:hypothetical protein
MSRRLRIEMGEIKKNIRLFDDRANDAIGKVFQYQQGRSEAFMRTNAPWTDDTGNARSGLFTQAERAGNTHTLLLAHSVSYGIFLETMQAGRYGIIVPAWRQGSDELWRTLSRLFALMEGG